MGRDRALYRRAAQRAAAREGPALGAGGEFLVGKVNIIDLDVQVELVQGFRLNGGHVSSEVTEVTEMRCERHEGSRTKGYVRYPVSRIG